MGELEGPAWGASRLWFDSSRESGSVSCPVVVVVVVVLLLGIGFLAMVVSSSDASWFEANIETEGFSCETSDVGAGFTSTETNVEGARMSFFPSLPATTSFPVLNSNLTSALSLRGSANVTVFFSGLEEGGLSAPTRAGFKLGESSGFFDNLASSLFVSPGSAADASVA